MGVEPKIGFFPPKMDGLFHKIDDLGGKPLLLETPIYVYLHLSPSKKNKKTSKPNMASWKKTFNCEL